MPLSISIVFCHPVFFLPFPAASVFTLLRKQPSLDRVTANPRQNVRVCRPDHLPAVNFGAIGAGRQVLRQGQRRERAQSATAPEGSVDSLPAAPSGSIDT